MLEYEFVAEVPICTPPLYIRYPVTPDVTCPATDGSVEADQVKFIWLEDTAVAESPEGIEGEVVSSGGEAVTVTMVCAWAEP